MKKILFLFILCVLFLPLAAQAQLTALQQSYSSAVTFYVCPSGQTTCTYDGDGGTSATPSDSNNCLTKATPCATIAQVRSLIANKTLNAVVTIQLADQSGGRCYQPDGILFDQSTRGGAVNIFDVALNSETDRYPQSYIYLKGNLTTPNNVPIVGATTCAGTTPSVKHAFVSEMNNVRIAGMQFKYFAADSIAANNRALVYIEKTNALQSASYAALDQDGLVHVSNHSMVKLGGAVTVADTMVVNADNSVVEFHTPTGYLNLTYSSSGLNDYAFLADEKSHIYIEGITATFTGSRAYVCFGSLIGSTINWNSDVATSITVNAANAVFLKARQGGYIAEACGATNQTCTFTSMNRRAWVDDGGIITLGSTSGFGTTGNLQQNGGVIRQQTIFPFTNWYLPPYTSEERQLTQQWRTAGSQLYHAPNFSLIASEGTLTSPSAVSSAHVLGYLNWVGYDGSTDRGAAMIRGEATGAFSGSNWEGKVVIATASPGTGGTVDRVVVDQNGITSLYKGANVASAATITPTGNLFHVTGTTTITSVSGTNITAGTRLTIIFDGALTFTDGSNLKLAGNFVTTADDTIVLEYDGTNFYEVSRSVN